MFDKLIRSARRRPLFERSESTSVGVDLGREEIVQMVPHRDPFLLIDEVVEQTIALAEKGRKSGVTAPRILMERIPDQIAVQLVELPAESPFFRPFADLPERIPPAERERLRAELGSDDVAARGWAFALASSEERSYGIGIYGVEPDFEPQVSNLFKRETLSGEFMQINRYLVRELQARGLWDEQMITDIKRAEGSIQGRSLTGRTVT